MPVPMMQPIPNSISWIGPRVRLSAFFFAVARIASSGFTLSSNIGRRPPGPQRNASALPARHVEIYSLFKARQSKRIAAVAEALR